MRLVDTKRLAPAALEMMAAQSTQRLKDAIDTLTKRIDSSEDERRWPDGPQERRGV